MKIEIKIGDSLEFMKTLPDQSVNLIVTSPPFADQRKHTYGGVHVDEYVEWFKPFAAEMLRILADDGSFILNIKERVVDGERSTYVYELVMMMKSLGWRWTEEYMWHKTTSTPGKWPNRFRDLWEHLYHFTKQKKFVMNQDDVRVPIGDWSKSRLKNLSEKDMVRQNSAVDSGFGKNVSNWVGKDLVYPGNVLHGAPETSNVGHSAPFPVWLPEWFIKLFSNEGDVVYDPFMGSGSTAIAAINQKRNVIGSEQDEKQRDNMFKRIASYHPDVDVKFLD